MGGESKNQRDIFLNLGSLLDFRLFRNNVGFDKERKVKYGLCKGSSDLIGIKKVKITQDMVGKEVGIFTAIEVKSDKGYPTKEQISFIDMIKKFGGYAGVAKTTEDARRIIQNL